MSRLPKVTAANYFTPKIEMAYMGHTQYLEFKKCEAAALAMCRGDYIRPVTTALLVGAYVDAYFEGTVDRFIAEHPEIVKRDGTLKAEYEMANSIIKRMERDELFSLLMSGQKQVVRTGKIAGVPFKIKIDSLLDANIVSKIVAKFPQTRNWFGFGDGAIVDGKVMRDIFPLWSEEEHRKVPFVEAYGYDFQGAIYQAVEGHLLPFILTVATKEATPKLAAIGVSDQDLRAKLAEVEDDVIRFHKIKRGRIKPRSCGKCDWCRMHEKLDRIFDYREI